jgi:hypothetical protein
MPQPAIKKRADNCKVKVLNSLLSSYKIVLPAKDPFHFQCVDKNGHKFVRVEVNSIPEEIKKQLLEFKKECPDNTFIQVHFFKKHDRKAKLINI